MSRANRVITAISAAALSGVAACASSGATSAEQAQLEAYQQAIEEASRPASPEAIAAAERSDPLTRANFWGEEYRKNAADLPTIVSFMRALRLIGSHERITEIATTALPQHPTSYEIFLELGRSLMAQQKPGEAAQAFIRSADYSPPDVAAPLAALGVAFDQVENHGQAQQAYEYALAREPNRVSTLSNYGLSLALSGDLEQAEIQLRKAAALPGADMRIRQNLALILGLQGRYDEMTEVDPGAPRRTVDANRQALRDMMLPARDYSSLSTEPIDPVEYTRGPSVEMPAVGGGEISEDRMPDIETATTASEDRLAGAPDTATGLRPKLRGAQSG